MFEKSFRILNFGSNGTHPKLTVLVHFGSQFTTGNPKILLKIKISVKTPFFGISINVSHRSQKNRRILVKLSEKKTNIFWSQIASKFPTWGQRQRVIRNFHIAYNRPSIYTFWMPSFSFWYLLLSTLPRRKNYVLWFTAGVLGK